MQQKLMALEGLVNEIKKLRPDDQYIMGIWWLDKDNHLLWACSNTGSLRQGPLELGIPSWSWASRVRAVKVPPIRKNVFDSKKAQYHRISLQIRACS